MTDMTRKAIDAVGTAAGGDWKLEPDTHAANLPQDAAALRHVLEQPAIQTIMATFRAFDAHAVSA